VFFVLVEEAGNLSLSPKDAERVISRHHLEAMLVQIRNLTRCLEKARAWDVLIQEYPGISDIADYLSVHSEMDLKTVKDKLIQLYGWYIQEWERVYPFVGNELPGKPITLAAA
jgi:hypothetical protein